MYFCVIVVDNVFNGDDVSTPRSEDGGPRVLLATTPHHWWGAVPPSPSTTPDCLQLKHALWWVEYQLTKAFANLTRFGAGFGREFFYWL